MLIRTLLVFSFLSASVLMPAPLRGQVDPPRSFQVFADGDDVVVRWWADDDADLFVGEIDADPSFASPSTWSVRANGSLTYESRIRDLAPGSYFVRLRAVRSFLVVSLGSDWTPSRRVDVGRSFRTSPGRLTLGDLPRIGDVRFAGEDVVLLLLPAATVRPAVLQIDTDPGFSRPFLLSLDPFRDRREIVVRRIPRSRFFVRVLPAAPVVVRDVDRVNVVVVNERVPVRGGFRREVELRGGEVWRWIEIPERDDDDDDQQRVLVRREVEFHPGHADESGAEKGKGHLARVGKKSTRGHESDRDERDD